MSEMKKKFPSKGKRGQRPVRRDAEKVAHEGKNDVNWYKNQISLFDSVANVNYANVLGLTVPTTSPGLSDTWKNVSIPSIMVLKYHTCFGISTNSESDVNVMSQDIYAWVRHKNSGSRNYEAPDYMTYLLAMSGVYQFYGEMVRLYGLTNIFSHMNRAINRGLIEALGYDYDDIVSNREKLLFFINYYAARANAFCVPKSFDLYVKHLSTPLGVWKDADNEKAGLYLFQPNYMWKWDGTKYDTGSALVQTLYHCNKVADIIALGNELLTNLVSNEDIGIMSGDTKKAFGDALFTLRGIEASYATPVTYSEEILAQIHHAIPTGAIVSNGDLTQENGYLVYNPVFQPYNTSDSSNVAATALTYLQPILDCGWKNPTADYNMIASRFMVTMNGTVADTRADALPDTFIIKIFVYGPQDWSSESIAQVTSPIVPSSIGSAGISIDPQAARFLLTKSYFDWAPIIYLAGYWISSASMNVLPVGEIFNYAVLSKIDLQKLHTVANLSLMTVKETKLL